MLMMVQHEKLLSFFLYNYVYNAITLLLLLLLGKEYAHLFLSEIPDGKERSGGS